MLSDLRSPSVEPMSVSDLRACLNVSKADAARLLGVSVDTIERDVMPDLPVGQITCPSPVAKIYRFSFDPNQLYIFRRPVSFKGAFRDRHER